MMLWLGALPLWTLFVAVAVSSAFNALEFPTFSALTTVLVPKEQLGRASGFVQLGWAVAQIVTPLAATVLISSGGLMGILVIDVVTFVFAACILLLLRMPSSSAPATEAAPKNRLIDDAIYGFRYLAQQKGLLRLLGLFFATNFNLGVVQVVVTPLVLGFAGARSLGLVLSVGGLGMLLGSGAMIAWGGPKKPVRLVLFLTLLQGMFLLGASAYQSLVLIGGSAFGLLFALPIIGGCSQMIWQRRVPNAIQGRVFAVRLLVAKASLPIAYLVSGPLLDYVIDPAMKRGGGLADSVGRVLGAGPGRGGALLLAVLGVMAAAIALMSLSNRDLQKLDEEEAVNVPSGAV
jgi:MFS family permease